jgi:ABC-type nitrate/sulfonate/bicarbonate transport system substrate-binding protein
MTRDEWRNYICCVLTVREELIKENPALVRDLVNEVLGAGVWLDAQQAERDKAVDRRRAQVLQSGPEYPAVRDGESDGPGDLRRFAHDPIGVRD